MTKVRRITTLELNKDQRRGSGAAFTQQWDNVGWLKKDNNDGLDLKGRLNLGSA